MAGSIDSVRSDRARVVKDGDDDVGAHDVFLCDVGIHVRVLHGLGEKHCPPAAAADDDDVDDDDGGGGGRVDDAHRDE